MVMFIDLEGTPAAEPHVLRSPVYLTERHRAHGRRLGCCCTYSCAGSAQGPLADQSFPAALEALAVSLMGLVWRLPPFTMRAYGGSALGPRQPGGLPAWRGGTDRSPPFPFQPDQQGPARANGAKRSTIPVGRAGKKGA